jgi:hypothetical protein
MKSETKVTVLLYAIAEIHSLCLKHSLNSHRRLKTEGYLRQAIEDICREVVVKVNRQEPKVIRKRRMMAGEKKQYMYLWGDLVAVGKGETRSRTCYCPGLGEAKRGAASGGGIVERIIVGGRGESDELWPGNADFTPAGCYGRVPKKVGRS